MMPSPELSYEFMQNFYYKGVFLLSNCLKRDDDYLSEHKGRVERLRQIVDAIPSGLQSDILMLYDCKGSLTVLYRGNNSSHLATLIWAQEVWEEIGHESEDEVRLVYCKGDFEYMFM